MLLGKLRGDGSGIRVVFAAHDEGLWIRLL